jgi:predicted small secreted protein
MKKTLQLLLFSLSLTGLFILSGCNTIDGAGEDIENAGDAIQDSAN